MSKKKNYAYVDGSFNPETKVYGWGGFLVDQNGKKHLIQGSDKLEDLAKLRNVAGEISGAVGVICKAISLGMEHLTLYYDYDGVANWPLKRWKCKNSITIYYAQFVQLVMRGMLKIHFQKVKGHAGILGNEEADRLAKRAVGIVVKKGNKKHAIKQGNTKQN